MTEERKRIERLAMRFLLSSAANILSQIERLPAEQKSVLKMRFGFGDRGDHTLEEVGRDFEATREHIRDVELEAIDTLISKGRLIIDPMVDTAMRIRGLPKKETAATKMTPPEKLLQAIFGKTS